MKIRLPLAMVAAIAAVSMICISVATAFAADLSLEEIISKTQAKFSNVNTISVSVSMRQIDPSTNKSVRMGMDILADRNAGLSRMKFTEPAAFKDQVMILDQKARTMKVYTPITNQVMVSKLDPNSQDGAGFDIDFSSLLKIPEKGTHDIKLLGKEKVGKVDAYVVYVKEKKNSKANAQKIWLSVTDLNPLKVEVLGADGKLNSSIEVNSLKLGLSIDRKQLTSLPAGAEVVQQ